MKKNLILISTLAILLILSSCSSSVPEGSASSLDSLEAAGSSSLPSSAAQNAYHKITPEEAKEKMDAGNVTILDVRTPEEYAQNHIVNAVSLPNESISDAPIESLDDLEAVLLVYCRTGVRSKQAADKLIKLGYQNVYDFGGIADWPFELEEGEGKSDK